MSEVVTAEQKTRKVIRHSDFNLPQNWVVQSENVAQFALQVDSQEYKEIVTFFHQTMSKLYTQIIRIDRIQSKQWYMQYNTYKQFSTKKDTERKLFHGCPKESADKIIESFFNRTFAGVNGQFVSKTQSLSMFHLL